MTRRFFRDPNETPSHLEIDTDRINDLVTNAIFIIDEYLGFPEYNGTKEKALADLKRILDSRKVALERLDLFIGNEKMNDLYLELNLKKKIVVVRSYRFKKKRAHLNSLLRKIK